MRQIALELVSQIGETLQVFRGAAHTALSFAPTFLVFGNAGGLFDENPEFLGLRLDQPRHHSLLDNGVTARTQTRPQKQIGDVTPATLCPVQVVLRLCLPGDHPTHRDFVVGGKLTGNLALSVVENQFDGRLTDGLATGCAIENDIGHRLAAQGLRGALAHYPSDGVDNVGLAAAVRADYRTHVARKLNRGGIDKRLKTGQFYGFQAHY